MTRLSTSGLQLGSVSVSGKGQKSIPLQENGAEFCLNPGPLRVLWKPSGYQAAEDANRVSICFEPTPEAEEDLGALDGWVLNEVASDPRKYLGQSYTPEQVKQMYLPVVRTSEKGYKSIRANMTLSSVGGAQGIKVWDAATRLPRSHPEDWTKAEVQPLLLIRGLWIMARTFALAVECTDAMVLDKPEVCPAAFR